jgi:hypothetical protein
MKLTGPKGIQLAAAAAAGFLVLFVVYDAGRASVPPSPKAHQTEKDWFTSLPDVDSAEVNGVTALNGSARLAWDSVIPADPSQRTAAQEELYQARLNYNADVWLNQRNSRSASNQVWTPMRHLLELRRARHETATERRDRLLKEIQDEAREKEEQFRRQHEEFLARQEELHKREVESRLQSIDEQLKTLERERSWRQFDEPRCAVHLLRHCRLCGN